MTELDNPSLVGTPEYLERYRTVLKAGSERLGNLLNSAFLDPEPTLAVVLGSGLGPLADAIEIKGQISFSDLSLPTPTVIGHDGVLIAGSLSGAPVLLQKGRVHIYEGHTGPMAALPIRMMLNAGLKEIVITNAAGYLDPAFETGQIGLISGLSFSLTGALHPSAGVFGEMIGEKFYAPSLGYSTELREKFSAAADRLGIGDAVCREGVYVYRFGPNYEEENDIWELCMQRSKRIEEGRPDLAPMSVGMSTAPEILAVAQYNAMRIEEEKPLVRCLAISNFTNPGAGLKKGHRPSHAEVVRDSAKGGERIQKLITDYVAGR